MTGRVLGFEVIRRKNGNGFASCRFRFCSVAGSCDGGALPVLFAERFVEVMPFFPLSFCAVWSRFSDLHFGAVWACLRRFVRARFLPAGCR